MRERESERWKETKIKCQTTSGIKKRHGSSVFSGIACFPQQVTSTVIVWTDTSAQPILVYLRYVSIGVYIG